MSAENWNHIIEFYEDLKTHSGWEEAGKMEILVRELTKTLDLSSFYPYLSDQSVCISKFATYEERIDKPLLAIGINWEATERYKCKISLTQSKVDDEGGKWREYLEAVSCSFIEAPEVFGEMIAKLEEASK